MSEDFGFNGRVGPDTGSNSAYGYRTVKVNPQDEYVVTGPNRFSPQIPQAIDQHFDDVLRNYGFKVYEAMLTDPAVYSSFLALKLAILSGPNKVVPAVRPKGYREGQTLEARPGAKATPKEKMAIEVAEFNKREIKRPKRSFKSILLQMYDAMAFGNKLGEKVLTECEVGPDKGKLVLKSIKVKPSWSWQFVVDATMEPTGILTYIPPLPGKAQVKPLAWGSYAIIPIDKFMRFTWLPIDNDPRGTSALRAAYDWWNLKRQAMPFYYEHLRRFGSPSLDGVMAEKDNAARPPIDEETGLEIPNVPMVTPAVRFGQALRAYQNNSVIVRPFGSELNVIEPNSNGESFLNAFEMFDRQICLAIGLQARASLEAKHGSKADSETASDTRGLVIAYGREEGGSMVERELFYEQTKINYGEEIAEECTPTCVVGSTEDQDVPTMITAVSSAGFTIGPSQLEEIDVMVGLPERDPEADMELAKQQMEHAAELAAASKPAAPGGQPGKPASKPKPKPKGTAK